MSRPRPSRPMPSWTDQPGLACTVLVADCLPVLFAAPTAAWPPPMPAGAGWRPVCSRRRCRRAVRRQRAAHRPMFAPGSGRASVRASSRSVPTCCRRSARCAGSTGGVRFVAAAACATGTPRWLADLAGLARDRLLRAGRDAHQRRRRAARSKKRSRVLLVPARRRHRAHGRRRLAARLTAACALGGASRAPPHRRADHVQHDRQRQHAVQQQREERAEQRAVAGDIASTSAIITTT